MVMDALHRILLYTVQSCYNWYILILEKIVQKHFTMQHSMLPEKKSSNTSMLYTYIKKEKICFFFFWHIVTAATICYNATSFEMLPPVALDY